MLNLSSSLVNEVPAPRTALEQKMATQYIFSRQIKCSRRPMDVPLRCHHALLLTTKPLEFIVAHLSYRSCVFTYHLTTLRSFYSGPLSVFSMLSCMQVALNKSLTSSPHNRIEESVLSRARNEKLRAMLQTGYNLHVTQQEFMISDSIKCVPLPPQHLA